MGSGRTVSATEMVACLSLRRAAISSDIGLIEGGGNSGVMVASGLVDGLVLMAVRRSSDLDLLAQVVRMAAARNVSDRSFPNKTKYTNLL